MKRKKPKHEGYNWHHRKAKVNGGSGKISSPNMVEVDVLQHRAYHLLFGIKTPEQVAAILNKTWIDPDYELITRKREVKTHKDYVPLKHWENSHLPLDKGGIHPNEEKKDGQPDEKFLPPTEER